MQDALVYENVKQKEQHILEASKDEKWRVLIAEDETLVREGLKAMLSSDPSFEVVAEAADGMEAIRSVEETKPDLVLLDLNMPKMSGIAALRNIRKQSESVKILALTIHEGEEYVLDVFRLGGNGYCLKEASREELFLAIRSVLAGKPYASPEILDNVLAVYMGGRPEAREGPMNHLSVREQEILKLIGEGYSVKEISEYLFISRRTVEKHRYNIMKKLNLHRTSALVCFAMENGLVTSFRKGNTNRIEAVE